MDLYVPRDRPIRGAVVLMHGGSFVSGSRGLDENRAYGGALARRGFLVAAVSYRLLGDLPRVGGWAREYSRSVLRSETRLLREAIDRHGPEWTQAVAAAAEDLISAVVWLRDHASEFGLDPSDVALFGASAGAITSLTVAYALDEYGGPDLELAGVVSLRGLLLRPGHAGDLFEGAGPPLLILHGEADRRVPLAEAESLFRMAKDAKLPVELYTAPGAGHELGGDALLRMKLDQRRTVLDRLDGFLERVFSDEARPRSSLRGRLLDTDNDSGASGTVEEVEVTTGEAALRDELASAVGDLAQSVQEEGGFVASLYGVSKRQLLLEDFESPSRMDWSYWPRRRTGLPLRYMTAAQRLQTHRILSTLLSSKGYLQVNHVMMLEELLAFEDAAGFHRGAEEYTITVFGAPSPNQPWGLRFEGHHVSLNVTVSPAGISVTPSFVGASPAPVSRGIRAGFHPLGHEERRARALLDSLSERQRSAAILSDRPLPEIATTQFQVESNLWDRWRKTLSRDGISAATFDAAQKRALGRLLEEIAGTYHEAIGEGWLGSLDLDSLAFAWMGDPEADGPHYFRIQGEHFVFEWDAVQEGGRHVHTVWRDRDGDFGNDVLRSHYREHHQRGSQPGASRRQRLRPPGPGTRGAGRCRPRRRGR